MTLKDILIKYHKKLASLDLELIIAHVLKKPREFVLAHPETRVAPNYELRIKNYANRRMRGEPLAYILGHKEFYGLDFKVDKNTLIPRPETELLVELAIQEIKNSKLNIKNFVIDVGTGSGNIIISMAKIWTSDVQKGHAMSFYGIDISSKALRIAKHNAKKHRVDKKIKFIKGNLLEPIFKKNSNVNGQMPASPAGGSMVILANLPYLSKEIYNSAPISVKKYEPKSALYSSKAGLAHYEKLLKQIKELSVNCQLSTVKCLIEISPEQKKPLNKLIKKHFPGAKIAFFRDLSGRWRLARIEE